jgi:hypothetical protein
VEIPLTPFLDKLESDSQKGKVISVSLFSWFPQLVDVAEKWGRPSGGPDSSPVQLRIPCIIWPGWHHGGVKSSLAALVALLLIAGTSLTSAQTAAPVQSPPDPARLARWKEAIEDVFRIRLALRQKLLRHKMTKRKYAADILQIDTTACPKSFRIAWLHYVEAWQKLSTDPSGIVPLAEIVVSAGAGNVVGAAHGATGLAKDASQKNQDAAATTVAMLECQEAAIKYNASITPD